MVVIVSIPSQLNPEDGSVTFVIKVGNHIQVPTAPQPGRKRSATEKEHWFGKLEITLCVTAIPFCKLDNLNYLYVVSIDSCIY
jgi:hypothetical protein